MGSINLYKIDNEKQYAFFQELAQKLLHRSEVEINQDNGDANETFKFTLYTERPQEDRDLSWNWILEEFRLPTVEVTSASKAALIIEKDDGSTYAVSFGSAFFIVDKFCDRDFGFNFARRICCGQVFL